jgi:mannonate dehydratase
MERFCLLSRPKLCHSQNRNGRGIYGVGDATLNGRELAVKAYLEEHVIPCLIGRDANRIEDTRVSLSRRLLAARPVTMTAIAAVDTALWDIKGKAVGLPVYQLLGGRSRDAVLVYGHANGGDHAEAVAAVGQYIDLGYKAIRVQSGVPGLDKAYGVGKGSLYYEPADKGCPTKRSGIPLSICATRLNSSKGAYGSWRRHPSATIDHHRLKPIEAARLGKALEPYKLFWMEDPRRRRTRRRSG